MSHKILSVVVPAYNMEQYLNQCLDSFIIPEIMDDIEVIIVNDGSKDNTSSIAGEYVQKYPDVYRLYDKENGGHGSGINYGIKYATGKYFKIVDADDWVNKDNFAHYIGILKDVDADIIATDFACVSDETGDILQVKKCTANEEQYGKICSMHNGEINQVIKMHSMTIKTNILKNNNIVIDEKYFYVDVEYVTYPIPYVDKVYFCSDLVYMYRLGRNGQSVDIKSMQKRRKQHETVLNHLLEFYAQDKISTENTKKYIEKSIGLMVENQFQIFISMGLKKGIYSELKAWDKNLKEKFSGVYYATNKKSIDILRATGYLILPIGALVYKLVKKG